MEVFKALAVEAEEAYQVLVDKSLKKLPSFSAERFSATVSRFCDKREHEYGGPVEVVFAISCQYDRLKAKYEELKAWRACMNRDKNKKKPCKFPDERFDKSKKPED